MSTLPAATLARLVKTLALLASDVPGERTAAAEAAHRIVVASGMTWAQVLGSADDDDTESYLRGLEHTLAKTAYDVAFNKGYMAGVAIGSATLEAAEQKRSRERARQKGYAEGVSDTIERQSELRQKEVEAAYERGIDIGRRLLERDEHGPRAGVE